ncbi:uncharacterized protein LOC109545329 [Dendroctonus ponderosae]|uniref:uncharacterized protein LOC109545329 n=1 Tax=Dendroctonus ponderosae TaxID=77166 RepID=UPI0020361FB5|nr:uncharacterized protein LOC109545329 [Dendroctonus ponderosae]
MATSGPFAPSQIEDVLKSAFPIFAESELIYSVADWQQTNYLLDVQSAGFKRQFVLVKVPADAVVRQQTNPALLSAIFTLPNNPNEVFLAFDANSMRDLQPAARNNLNHLRALLETLAEVQVADLIQPDGAASYPIGEPLCDEPAFAKLDQEKIETVLQELQENVDGLLKTEQLVRSVWSPGASNAYVLGERGFFLDVSPSKSLPPMFDALMYIFSLSDARFRQEHFEALLRHYCNTLNHLRENQRPKPLRYQEEQLKILLPLVKIQQLSTMDRSQNRDLVEELAQNVSNYFACPIINQEDVNEVVKNYLESTDYTLEGYNLVPLDETNGHLGEYFHLDIRAAPGDGGEAKPIQLFAKFLITNTELAKRVIHAGPGKKEDFFYTTLYPDFVEHGLHDLLDYAPKCYLSRNCSLLVLDDLNEQGFTSLTPNNILDYQSVRVVVSKLANFHCCSIILEEILSKTAGRPVKLSEIYGEFLKDVVFDPNTGVMKNMLSQNVIALQHMAAKCPDLTKKLGMDDSDLNTALAEAFYQIYTLKTHEEFRNVINHGDMYIANYLLKMNQAKTAEDVKIIDFQMLRYIPPAAELMFCIVSSTSKQVRDEHLLTLIEGYYAKVARNLKAFGLQPEEVFPKEQFEKSLKNAKFAATMLAFCYGNITHIDPDFRVEVMHDNEKSKYYIKDHRDELIDMFWDNQHYQGVMKGLIADIVDAIQENKA